MGIEEKLKEILLDDASPREIEPHIYSVYPVDEAYYDEFGGIYERIACNRFYNRLIWGYWISEFRALCADALKSAKDSWVLDAGCGSLAFTAKAYIQYKERPTVLLDQSIRMLRLAKERLIELNGSVPDNMLFVQGDISHLPFNDGSFGTIIAMNVLHAVKDAGNMVLELRRVMAESGSVSFTTLAKNGRLADRYIDKLGKMGAMVPRSLEEVLEIFGRAGLPVQYFTKGNLTFLQYGKSLEYFQGEASKTAGAIHE